MKRERDGKVEWFREPEAGFLDGLHLASPEMQEVIRHKARWKGLRTPPPTVVGPDDFLTEGEVSGLLQRRVVPGTDYRRLRAVGLLLEAYRATDGEAGDVVVPGRPWRPTVTDGEDLVEVAAERRSPVTA